MAKTVSVVKGILCIVLHEHSREHVRLFDEVSQFYRQLIVSPYALRILTTISRVDVHVLDREKRYG